MERILRVATDELGVREITGSAHNPRIVNYAQEAGITWINDDETPWCSVFMNWVATKAKFQRSNSAAARSWLNTGFEITDPEPGDIVIYWRESPSSEKGHVGIFMGYSKDQSRIYTLGGNQNNAVSLSAYETNRLLGFRRLRKIIPLRLSTDVLERGDKGPKVVKLQDALKMAGFNCGTSDGDFGPKTEAAVNELQTHSGGLLIVNGIFDRETRLFLKDLISALLQ